MPFAGSEALVAAAETALGRRLPDAHRDRLIRENGGEVRAARETWSLYPVWDGSNRKTIARTTNHIVRENDYWRHEWPDTLPAGYLTIGENVGGDHLVLGPDQDDVLFWDHETGELTRIDVNWG